MRDGAQRLDDLAAVPRQWPGGACRGPEGAVRQRIDTVDLALTNPRSSASRAWRAETAVVETALSAMRLHKARSRQWRWGRWKSPFWIAIA